MVSPRAEVHLDEDDVRSLLHEQHPDLSGFPLKRLDAGWDNTMWRLGDRLLIRLPRRAEAAELILNEQRWLASIAPRLPLQVPTPVRLGVPNSRFPWSWSIVNWIEGKPGDRCPPTAIDDAAARLGGFLCSLHQPADPDAPRNPYRGVPLLERRTSVDHWVRELGAAVDEVAVRNAWKVAWATPTFEGPPVWLHGDLHPANLIVANGTISGVVDFGDICAGDPATDLASVFLSMPEAAEAAFTRAYGPIDRDLRMRAAGWALHLGLVLLAIGLDDKPTYAPIGQFAIRRATDQLLR